MSAQRVSDRAGDPFAARYRRRFLAYLASGDEADLLPAYEHSSEAVGGRLSLLELAEAHRVALAEGVLGEPDPARRAQLADRAAAFLRESLATFEIAHRRYRDAQETARLEHEHARQLQSIAEVSVALGASLPVEDIVELVTAEARQLLGAAGARAQVELPGPEPRMRLTAASGTIPRAGSAPDLRAPLTGPHGLPIGTLELFALDERQSGDEAILVQLAQVTSAAITNAHLYGVEREIAETLQAGLLPQELPRIEGLELAARYCPAGDGVLVGGDFYDAFHTHERGWGIAIGDVCGKGPGAAALTALVRYTLRAAALWERRPERVMALLNEAILEQHPDHRFCTLLYGQLERRADGGARLEFVLCGHPPPLLLRADGTVTPVGSPSSLLGIVPDPDLRCDRLEIGPGDLLLLYTDGATEVRRHGREVFGMRELGLLLGELHDQPAAKVADRVEDAVLNASGGPPRDDIAIVALRVPPVA